MKFLNILLIILGISLFPLLTYAFTADINTQSEQANIQIGNDIYQAGHSIIINKNIPADAFFAGGMIQVRGNTGEDLTIAGGNITITGNIADDLRVAGGMILIEGDIGGDLLVTGGEITIGKNASITGETILTGGKITFEGIAEGDITLAGEEVYFSGQGQKNAKIYSSTFIPSDTANIKGTLTYATSEKLPLSKNIAKTIIHNPNHPFQKGVSHSFSFANTFFKFITLFVTGALLLALIGRFSVTLSQTAQKKMGMSFLSGILFFLIPIIIVFLMFTGVGIYLGGIVLLAWIMTLLLGILFSSIIIGSFLIQINTKSSYTKKLFSFSIGSIVLLLIGSIPYIGESIVFLIFLFSIGALILTKKELYPKLKKAKIL